SFSQNRSSEKFFERLPIVEFPSAEQVLGIAVGESGMVKENFRFGAFRFGSRVYQVESYNRENSGLPISDAPGLNDSFVGHKFQVPTDDAAAEQREAAADFPADCCGLGVRRTAGF